MAEKFDIQRMTPAQIRADSDRLWKDATGQPIEPTAADIRAAAATKQAALHKGPAGSEREHRALGERVFAALSTLNADLGVATVVTPIVHQFDMGTMTPDQIRADRDKLWRDATGQPPVASAAEVRAASRQRAEAAGLAPGAVVVVAPETTEAEA